MWPQAYAKDATGNVQQLRDLARTYPNVSTLVEPTAILTAPEPLDVVWTSDNFHDYNDKFMGNPGPAVLAKICLQGAQARWPPNRHRPRGGDRPRPA
jgi:predicted methyltransferase